MSADEASRLPGGGERVAIEFVADRAAREAWIEAHPGASLVAEWLPLRANLSALENIAMVPRYRSDLDAREAEAQALRLLARVGMAGCAHRRDPELDREERFVTKLLQAVLLAPPLIVVDRPALLLPDTRYPEFLARVFGALDGEFAHCLLLDYAWNAPLYRLQASAASA